MDGSADDLHFDFRNPLSSGEDTDSGTTNEESEVYTSSLDEMMEYEHRRIGPIFQASHLEIAMHDVMSALLKEQDKEDRNMSEHDLEGTNSGPPSTFMFGDLDLSLALANFIDIYFNKMSVIKDKTGEVHGKLATAVDESNPETDMLPIRKRKIREEETAELDATKGRVARSRTLQKGMIAHAIQEGSRGTAESLKQVDPSTPDLIVGGKQMLGHIESKAQVSSSTPTQPLMVTGSSSRRSSKVGEIVTSHRERLRARFLEPSYYENCYVCFKCCTQQSNNSSDRRSVEQCMLCSRSTSWGRYKDGTIKWITEKVLHDMAMSVGAVSVLFQPIKGSLFFEIYESNRDGQVLPRALLLKLPSGNILWDCISTIYEDTMVDIAKTGGLRAIAISSPDHMRNCDRLSYIFNRCPIYFHLRGCLSIAVSRRSTRFWATSKEVLWDGVTLIHLGGHFPGSCILHLNRNRGIIFSGNTLKVGKDKETVSVMLDYNFQFPASPRDVKRILHIMEDLEFDELYGDLPGDNIVEHAKKKVIFSLRRYIGWVQHDEDSFESEYLTPRERIARGKRKLG